MYTISKEYARTALAHNGTIGVFVLSVRARVRFEQKRALLQNKSA